MQEVINLVLAALPNVGDRKTYREIYESLPGEKRHFLRNAYLHLKSTGQVKAEVKFVDGVNHHDLVRVGS